MTIFKIRLLKLGQKWRLSAGATRIAAEEMPNLLARGHMNGMSDGLDLAADDVDELLATSDSASLPTAE